MGIQFLVVSIGIGIALAAGVFAGTVGPGIPLAAWLAVGMVPVMWAVVLLIERVTGIDLWHYSAPYPYRTMEVVRVTEASGLETGSERELATKKSDEILLAA